MKRGRVAILGTRGIPARYGGFETFAEELSLRLAERGFDITVFCEHEKGQTRPEKRYKDVLLAHVRAPRIGPMTTILYDLKCLVRVRKKFDIVYMLGYGASIFCFIPRLWGAKVLINMDGVEWLRSKWSAAGKLYLRTMERFAITTADHIIADAEGIRQHLKRRYRRMPPCTVIPYGAELLAGGMDASPVSDYGLEPENYFLIVCRLEPENHVIELLEGFISSRSRKLLAVVGDKSLGTPYVRCLREFENDPRVVMLGTVFDKKRLSMLRYHAFAYMHGHSVGGTNPSLLEALGAGNPVIAHDNVFNREVAGHAARYFRNKGDVAGIIDEFESDESMMREMRSEAHRRVETTYNWESITTRYESLFKSLLERNARLYS